MCRCAPDAQSCKERPMKIRLCHLIETVRSVGSWLFMFDMAGYAVRRLCYLLGPRRIAFVVSTNKRKNNTTNYHRFLQTVTRFLNTGTPDGSSITSTLYEKVCKETLDTLSEYVEEIVDQTNKLENAEVSYGDGVLTINLGKKYGTYVINRQLPNKQIWLSSPKSGPKRFDFVAGSTDGEGEWVYKHTGESLHGLLQDEFGDVFKDELKFTELPFSTLKK